MLSSLAVSPERSHRRPTALRAGQLLFHLQHTFEESYKSRPPYYCAYTNAMRGCSYIPAPVSGPNRRIEQLSYRQSPNRSSRGVIPQNRRFGRLFSG